MVMENSKDSCREVLKKNTIALDKCKEAEYGRK